MRNKLVDLNNHLFAQLERLADEDITGKELEEEITRSKAITDVAREIIRNAAVVLEAVKHTDEYGYSTRSKKLPVMLTEGAIDHES